MKICLEDGCWAPTPGTRCMKHEREFQAARNAQPKRAAYRAHKRNPVPVGNACWCCGATEDLTKHHVQPLAGTYGFDNATREAGLALIPMCRSCNSSIGAKTMAGLACPLHGGEEA